MAAVLKRGLEEEGYAVDVALTGEEEGLWMAVEYPSDVIVLDVMLPDMDGFELCRRLRERGQWAPVLMLTARGAVADRVRGLDAGADDYLTKPFSFHELAARTRALLRRGGRRAARHADSWRPLPGSRDPGRAPGRRRSGTVGPGVRAAGVFHAAPRGGAVTHPADRARLGFRL